MGKYSVYKYIYEIYSIKLYLFNVKRLSKKMYSMPHILITIKSYPEFLANDDFL